MIPGGLQMSDTWTTPDDILDRMVIKTWGLPGAELSDAKNGRMVLTLSGTGQKFAITVKEVK